CFAENGIDFEIVTDLTDQDLEKIGVTSLGHRRKLLRAIANLKAAEKAAHAPAAAVAPPAPRTADTAERRQVTVMFSDLVGSTALAARMDPEDLRDLISAYHKCVAEAVRRLGGVVAQYLGDGVLVYFGYPEAHEDDAERAVRAGLEVIAAVGAIKTPALLQTRVGIATGLVVVGDLTGSGEGRESGIVGETPNLAARLQGIAEPNSVVIAAATRRLLGNLFELRDLGARDLKGLAEPERTWVALRESTVESRFEAMHPSALTALVGREEETELLLRRWSRAKSGDGQVVLISGEPGIGKSRLTVALLESIAPEPHTRLRYFCSPQHTDSAFYPIIGHMERAAGMLHNDTPKQKLDKLDGPLAQTSTSNEDAALIAEMLSLPNDGRHPALELTPQQRRQKTMQALTTQIETLSRKKPVLMILEDAHWADPTSLEAFGRAVDRIRRLRVLLLVTFRPEFDAPWVGRPYVTALIINRLPEHEAGAIIDRIVGNRLLSASIRQDIIDRSDGIPLFVEEMTKAVLEAGSETAAKSTVAAVPVPALAVPASLHASLMARLDRLGGPAKELAQIAAAVGREFPHALLASVARQPETELKSALDRLIAAGLLFRRDDSPHATYLFKHALVQDAAYGTLLREPRRALHARIAEAIENEFAETAENRPELLARHCTEACLIEKAAGLWGKAGQRSLARSALVEAAEQLRRALDQIATLPSTPVLRGEQIKLQIALVNALMHVKGYAAPEPKAAIEQARQFIEAAEALGEHPEDPLLLFSVLYGVWAANYVAFNGDVTRELASQFVALAEKRTETVPVMIGHRLMGNSLMLTGDIAKGRAHYDQAFALYDPAKHRSLATRFGQDVGVSIFVYRALAQWMLGYPETALADADHALENARESGHAGTLMYAQFHTSLTNILCAKYAAANTQSNEVVRLADEKGAALWKALATMQKGCVLALSGKASEGIQIITSGITTYRSTGSRVYLPIFLAHLSRAHAELGQFDEAWHCIGEAIAAVETTKERWYEAEINRIAGEIALKLPQLGSSQAEVYLERALTVARAQQAKSWELRAAMSMARFWLDQGMREKAHALLAPIYGWFTEGFDTRDLKQAKALLEGAPTLDR
ncbi:MAG TPA: adenylate/guanylate cyclase domain-containing protein, partial [Xanthobacteraceae bacterium]|nr:adenylate/guanylate cyclase domain-containing protein [Xanthobacteraceae bacterium]